MNTEGREGASRAQRAREDIDIFGRGARIVAETGGRGTGCARDGAVASPCRILQYPWLRRPRGFPAKHRKRDRTARRRLSPSYRGRQKEKEEKIERKRERDRTTSSGRRSGGNSSDNSDVNKRRGCRRKRHPDSVSAIFRRRFIPVGLTRISPFLSLSVSLFENRVDIVPHSVFLSRNHLPLPAS